MAVITTGAPVFFMSGAQATHALVGIETYRRIARYEFTVPSGLVADEISVNFGKITLLGGSASEPLRYKVTTSPTSHANAGPDASYDGVLSVIYEGGNYYASINGAVSISQPGTYYLWIFGGGTNLSYWSWPNSAVSLTLTVRTYLLTINKGAHTSLEVKRGGVSLSDGASIAYGDVLNITFGADAGYEVAATLNGSPIQSGATHTVVGNVAVATTATALGLVYIDDGTQFVAAQIFIDNGSEWEQHMPFIDNGTEFELYT